MLGKTQHTKSSGGFSLGELLVVIAIISLATGIIISGFVSFRKSQTLTLDVQKIVSALNQARSETLLSKNSTVYGVYFDTQFVTVFTGATYTPGAAGNEVITLTTPDISITPTLNGGVNYVVFNRLTGETSQNGTVVVNSPSTSQSKTVTIYRTGLVDSQ